MNFLEGVAKIDVEGSCSVLVVQRTVLHEVGDRSSIFGSHDKILVHDESGSGTEGDVRGVLFRAEDVETVQQGKSLGVDAPGLVEWTTTI